MSSALAERLRERRGEIEAATLARVYAVADPGEVEDPEYAIGLREAVAAAIEYAIAAIEVPDREPPAVPELLLAQARAAERNGISLDTVLRRYSAGYTLLGDHLIEEARAGGILPGAELQGLMRAVAAVFDRLVGAISEEHRRQAERKPPSSQRLRTECVERLLAGELADTTQLHYDLDAHHLGALATGPGAQSALRAIAASLDCQLLLARHEEDGLWAWLGSPRPLDRGRLERAIASHWPTGATLATGELTQGPSGWRLTHHQAAAALPIALRGAEPHVRYADVALLSSIVRDEVLARSLRALYLEPLAQERDGGETLRETLRAYFAAERNVSSTAAALGVNRKTVTTRLRASERRLGRSLGTCAADLEVALRLEALEPSAASSAPQRG